jgi:hypothetical protein
MGYVRFNAVRLKLTTSLDIHAFLPLKTYQWCQDQLRGLSYEGVVEIGSIDPERVETQVHFQVYQLLRTKAQDHLKSQQLPILHLLSKPVGPWEWLSQQEQKAEEEIYDDPDFISEDQPYEDLIPVVNRD